ncbi:unnamed protein product [Onchocerca flexuosa]|uniref:Uncharacterized protein n=1 Tax=Onchocerca flexuosa TaxID=387005 RepID=A0A183HTN4_9BILA|nr:unnamed protein product [Onchocerca flexuosa]
MGYSWKLSIVLYIRSPCKNSFTVIHRFMPGSLRFFIDKYFIPTKNDVISSGYLQK